MKKERLPMLKSLKKMGEETEVHSGRKHPEDHLAVEATLEKVYCRPRTAL